MRRGRAKATGAAAGLAALALVVATGVAAQAPANPRARPGAPPPASPQVAATGEAAQAAPPADDPRRELERGRAELKSIEDSIRASDDARRRMEGEIEAMRNDRARLSSALIDTTRRAQEAETRVGEIEERLETAMASEAAIRRSLDGRRDLIAEVLAALQRIGRRPPPAVLASPEDILRAVRASMLLGAVVPELRSETEALVSDLNDLTQVRAGIATERESLIRETKSLADERVRIAALVEARRKALDEARGSLETETARMRELARQSADLKELIARQELESQAAARAAEDARKAAAGPKLALNAPRDPARLAPAIAFADAKGSVRRPVAGTQLKSFGAPDEFGGVEHGVSFATRAGAIVSAPCDGWVTYSGPWRTFGQLLIINAGGGYYIVLAGMDRINVNVGQFVLAGEPIATMGDGSAKTAAAVAIGAAQPVLYVELRKDGTAIDPGPWWAKPDLERVRG